MTTTAVRIAEIIEETSDIRSLRLVRDDGELFEPFEAGAHIDVLGPTGLLRQYSLCNPPHETSARVIAVKREDSSRGGSEALHAVAVDDVLQISEPRNLFALADDAEEHVLVAGGIGVTPLLSMAYDLSRRGARFQLHYFAREPENTAFAGLLLRADFADQVQVHLGVPRANQQSVHSKIAAELDPGAHVYTCGPEGFMEQVIASFAPVVGDAHVHVEHFTAAEIDSSGDTSFTVELDTGETFEVPADKSILAVLNDNDIEVFKSCEEGICGSCISGVLDGTPDHRDNCLSAAEKSAGDQMALCVSRAQSERLRVELY